ncbi:MAG: TonB-dependent receptor, partial [Acidobacteria bacterium]|nr:TonB-dependent receptor [Acidobacteriota bacterium]
MRRMAIWLGLLAVVAWGVAWAQEGVTTGSIFGKVVDPQGAPLPGATVTATSETGVKRSAVTDANGEFSIPFLTPGRYDVEVRLEGFAPFKAPVTLSPGQRITLNVTLQPGAEVVVTAAPVVDITATTVGTTVTDELMRSVPVGRTFSAVTYISPQVVTGPAAVGAPNPSIAGATGLENIYIVDGVNITNAAYGALGSYSIILGSLGTGINFDYVKEVQVKTGGYEAEFGEALGGVINVITKSGGNTFTGDVFGYIQPKALEAKREHIKLVQVPEVWTRGTQQFDVGFDAGGKLVQDKLFWFLAFDPTWHQVERVAPPGFPLSPCGSGEEFCEKPGHTTTRRIYNYAGKLTFNVNPNHILEVSLFGDPGVGDKGLWRESSFLRDVQANVEEALRFGGHNQVGRWTGMFGSNLLIEAQLANHFDEMTEKDYADIESIVDLRTTPSRLYGGLGYAAVDKNRNLQGTLKLTYIVPNLAGRHEFKIGGNFQRLEYEHT